MIQYVVFQNNAESKSDPFRAWFGICACEILEDYTRVIQSVSTVSDNLSLTGAIAEKLNRNEADPIHLIDIIDDELFCSGKAKHYRTVGKDPVLYAHCNL